MSAPLAAQIYKWVDDRGVTNYGNKPPAGRPARLVEIDMSPPAVARAVEHKRSPAASARHETEAPPQAASPASTAPAAVPVRGMGFNTFARLQRGMSEGELLQRAGQPDEVAVENFRNDVVKSYYYFPTHADPFITVVTVRGSRIENIERTKKTF